MELISSIGALIAAAAAAVFGHFFVHDLYKGAPSYAKRLLDHAVKILPEVERERYAEEWLAHLQEYDSVIGKFRHAIECAIVARKLRHIVEKRRTAEPDAVESVLLTEDSTFAKVTMDPFTALPALAVVAEFTEANKNSVEFAPSEKISNLMADPRVSPKLTEFADAMDSMEGDGCMLDIHFVDRFGRILTSDELSDWRKKRRQ